MKVHFANKFFYPKGGSETVFFQERDFLINNGHKVVDFSMEHPDNLPSEYSDYFSIEDIPKANHTFSTRESSRRLFDTTIKWLLARHET